jgi:hypothetical protein
MGCQLSCLQAQNVVCRRKSPLLADLVQNTAEYASANIADLMSLRGVSYKFENAVSDAVGFLNDRCWTAFDAPFGATSLLWASRGCDAIVATNRCALVCLRHRLETLRWHVGRFLPPAAGHLPAVESLALAGAWNHLRGLRGCVALRELSLEGSFVPDTSFLGLQDVLSRVVKLNLSACTGFTSVSGLVVCTSLRELNLSRSSVNDLRGLERLPALEVLDLRGIARSCCWCSKVLNSCARLRALSTDRHCDHWTVDVGFDVGGSRALQRPRIS